MSEAALVDETLPNINANITNIGIIILFLSNYLFLKNLEIVEDILPNKLEPLGLASMNI
tara:strand:+ start:200 stop:376 length:177 start_codon:yes stop_codon:yes gene_type:complete